MAAPEFSSVSAEKQCSDSAASVLPVSSRGHARCRGEVQELPHSAWRGRLCWLQPLAKAILATLCLVLIYNNEPLHAPSKLGRNLQEVQGNDLDGDRIFHLINKSRMRKRMRFLTSIDRIAGSNGSLWTAHWVQEIFSQAGLEGSALQEIPVYLNYPKDGGRRVAVVDDSGHSFSWEAALEELPLYGDESRSIQTPVFHGYSRSGNVTGPLVYANFGSVGDFGWLTEQGIDLNGTVALVRYNGTQSDRSLKVKAAQLAGAIGCLIYSDPFEDGFRKGPVWPNGPWRPSDSVQRGSVALSGWVIGDPLTPGWASSQNGKTASKDGNPGLTGIPSLPLAWRDAQYLLQILEGRGIPVPSDWEGGVPDVQWWTGDQTSPLVNVMNMQNEPEKQPIYNVFGTIKGLRPNETIYVGNHRDAWCQGAADPASGTVAMLEVLEILGALRRAGWTPERSITFASWDAEEYNFVGSTEFVEGHMDMLRETAIAYLNVDVGVVGTTFRANGTPLFYSVLKKVLANVRDPITTHSLASMWKERGARFDGLAAGSDYVAFQDIAGVSSVDFGFEGPGYPAPYHSCYESYEWMERFGDPGFEYHRALAHFWVLLIVELSSKTAIPYDLNVYAKAVQGYVAGLRAHVPLGLGFVALQRAADTLMAQAAKFHLLYQHDADGFNKRVVRFERSLLDDSGVPGRSQYKHVLFGPQAWGAYDEAYFPAIMDAIEDADWTRVETQLHRAASTLTHAAQGLTE